MGERPETYSLEEKERGRGSLSDRRGGVECRTKVVKRMQKKKNPQVPFLHGPTVGDPENKSGKRKAQIDTFRDVAKY